MGRRLAGQQETKSRHKLVFFWLKGCNEWVSQGSVMKPEHFTIHAYNLDEGTQGMAAEFADEAK